jgi:hypothetical protein
MGTGPAAEWSSSFPQVSHRFVPDPAAARKAVVLLNVAECDGQSRSMTLATLPPVPGGQEIGAAETGAPASGDAPGAVYRSPP